MSEPAQQTPLQRFVDSMAIDYERWHDGIGYDLDAIEAASATERVEIERLLVARRDEDWRDVEALAALARLGSTRAEKALRKSLKSTNAEIRNAVTSRAPELVSDDERTRSLVDGLEHAVIYGGLTQTLLQVETFHPPEVVDALLRGAAQREGEVAVHLAAMLLFVHGKADSAFDMSQRPFFLRFAGPAGPERDVVFRELCSMIDVDPTPYI